MSTVCSNRDFTLGFGDQPGNVIRSKYLNETSGNSAYRTCSCDDNVSISNTNFVSFRADETISIHSSNDNDNFGGIRIVGGQQIILTGTSTNPTVLDGDNGMLYVDENACFLPNFDTRP